LTVEESLVALVRGELTGAARALAGARAASPAGLDAAGALASIALLAGLEWLGRLASALAVALGRSPLDRAALAEAVAGLEAAASSADLAPPAGLEGLLARLAAPPSQPGGPLPTSPALLAPSPAPPAAAPSLASLPASPPSLPAPSPPSLPAPSPPSLPASPPASASMVPASMVPRLVPRPQEERGGAPAGNLFRLFREDADAQLAALQEGLLGLDEGHGRLHLLEPLMRAAHSLKGAARVVRLSPIVDLTHAMEDVFVAAQRRQILVDRPLMDALFAAVDRLAAGVRATVLDPAVLVETQGTLFRAVTDRVRALLAAPSLPEPRREDPADAWRPEASTGDQSPDAARLRGLPAEDRVVRVTAEMADRLVGLASESVVEAQRVRPAISVLTSLRMKQSETADAVSSLIASLGPAARSPVIGRLLVDLAANVSECQQMVIDASELLDEHGRRSSEVAGRLYNDVLESRMRPLRDRTRSLRRMVRDVARQLGRDVVFEASGEHTLVDRDVLEKLEAPLGHLLRNAISHGIEPPTVRLQRGKPAAGRVQLAATQSRGLLRVDVRDDGEGVDAERVKQVAVARGLLQESRAASLSGPEILQFLFVPGFSTIEQVSDVSGRGVGLDAVRTTLEELGGHVRVMSVPGQGTTFRLEAPLTRAVVRCILVWIDGETFAVPLGRVDRVMLLRREDLRELEGRQYVEVEGENVCLLAACDVLDLGSAPPYSADFPAIVLSGSEGRCAIVVERFLGEEDLVFRHLDPRLGGVRDVSGVSTLTDGTLVLILDADDMLRSVESLLADRKPAHVAQADAPTARRILVVDDSITVREAERQLLEVVGYDVDVAFDGVDAWNTVRARRYDLVITDIDMPRMNGLDLVRQMKADEALRSIPVVVVSYKERDEDRLRGMRAGADFYFGKGSFDDAALLAVVRDLIGEPRS
jgi:two-component system sensor histidine kinase and response regulator WspE